MKKRLEEIKKSFLWWPMLTVLAVIILDQVTKIWTASASGNPVIYDGSHGMVLYTVIEGYFDIVDFRNTGAAWGIFAGKTFLLSLVSLAAFIYFIWDFPYLTENIKFRKFAWALLIGGVFGNFIDRCFYNAVIDMIQVNIPMPSFLHSQSWVNSEGVYPFPAFNIADSGICVGVFLYFVHLVFFSKKKDADSKTEDREEKAAEKETQTQ